jgi:DNA-binding MarR family transcriptional regulator
MVMRKKRLSGSEMDEFVCACAGLRQAARAVTQLYDRCLRARGTEAPQFALLAMLDRQGASNQATMGRRLDLDRTTLSRNLKLLKQKGWIEFSSGSDARERMVTLSPAGRRQLAAARPAWQAAQDQLRAGMTAKEWDAIKTTVRAATRSANAARSAASLKPRSEGKRT